MLRTFLLPEENYSNTDVNTFYVITVTVIQHHSVSPFMTKVISGI